ncbi:MAG: phospho-N-acetylmuramoyl-pentapeptide-transferase [Patescibacteria group bacterium]|jgi:phospho-N-acetylmuramoyl-pentapeptide-transferase
MELLTNNILALQKISWLTFGAFALAMLFTPILTDILYRYKLGKKIRQGSTPIFSMLHKGKENVPTMGGILIWLPVIIITLLFNNVRGQTWLPLFTLVCAALLGLTDDIYNVFRIGPNGGGIRTRHKLIWLLAIAFVGAWWFYTKLGWGTQFGIHIPGLSDVSIGWWYIPLFVFVIVGFANAVNITDGLDGLAGGLVMCAFGAYTIIAYVNGSYGLAAFCASIVGATLAFLWFNIYPARFIMGDTGSLALGATLGVVAMLTNTVFILPIIGSVFVIETLSVILQLSYRKITHGKKIFKVAPIHHHFEAIGWPEPKVTMRFWVVGMISAVIGILLALLGKG